MDPATHIEHLRADAALILEAQQADPHALAWAGTGWDRTELLAHVAGVHAWVREQLRLGTGERVRLSTIERPPEGDALPGWFEAGAAELVELLTEMDVDATWPTWAGPQPGSFFPRRMAQETSVHRWDAVGGELDADMAVDGVDELLQLFVSRLPAERFADVQPGTIHLHATDTDGEWLIRLATDGVTFEHGHAKGDVALRGPAADLLLWTWNRVPADDRFELFGDPAPLEVWRTAVAF